MKPRIYKLDGNWIVESGYFPRSFHLFGADAPERERITRACVSKIAVESWKAAIQWLSTAYLARDVRREGQLI